MAIQKLSKVVMRSRSPHISTHALTGPVPPPIALCPWVDPEDLACLLVDDWFFAFCFVLAEEVAEFFVASEGLEAAFSSLEERSAEEVGEEDLDVNLSDCMRLAKLGGAEVE
ncbi:MAG: hypothetical protein Q9175_003945 [Cornicularia normoerica]